MATVERVIMWGLLIAALILVLRRYKSVGEVLDGFTGAFNTLVGGVVAGDRAPVQ